MKNKTELGRISISAHPTQGHNFRWAGGVQWSTTMDAQMIELLREGRSCGQIAKIMGLVSRNSVIGRLHRLKKNGVTVPRSSFRPPSAAVKVKKAAAAVPVPPKREVAIAATLVRESKRMTDPRVILSKIQSDIHHIAPGLDQTSRAGRSDGIAFLNLRPGQCRYPLWPDTPHTPLTHKFVCGASVKGGLSWCPSCIELVVNRKLDAETIMPSHRHRSLRPRDEMNMKTRQL